MRKKQDDGAQGATPVGKGPDATASRAPMAGSNEMISGGHPDPLGVHQPASSIWPMVIAGAVAFTAFGIVTNYAFSAFGVVVMVVGIIGWVGELLHE